MTKKVDNKKQKKSEISPDKLKIRKSYQGISNAALEKKDLEKSK